MTSLQLLHELWARGVELECRDGDLRYSAPKGQITSQILAELKRHKASLLGLLEGSSNGQEATAASGNKPRRSKRFGIAIERPETSPLVPEDWRHPHPYFR